MRRAGVALVAITFGDAMLRGWLLMMTLFLFVGMVLAVRLQWRVSKKAESYSIPTIEPDPDLLVLVDDGRPGDAAASSVFVGLMHDGMPAGRRRRAKVLLDGSVRFVRPVFLPLPPDGYDEVAIWEHDESFGGEPLVRLSPWLCATETADGNVAIA